MNYSEGREKKRDHNCNNMGVEIEKVETEKVPEVPYVMTLKKSAVITMTYFHIAAVYGLYLMCIESSAANNWFCK